jgi:hypothetical protein
MVVSGAMPSTATPRHGCDPHCQSHDARPGPEANATVLACPAPWEQEAARMLNWRFILFP